MDNIISDFETRSTTPVENKINSILDKFCELHDVSFPKTIELADDIRTLCKQVQEESATAQRSADRTWMFLHKTDFPFTSQAFEELKDLPLHFNRSNNGD